MATLIYPIIACWVWGGGWLQELGFHDHGGSGVVHMTSGLAGMIGTYILGPRLGIFKDATPAKGTFEYTRRELSRRHEYTHNLERKLKALTLESRRI